MNSANIKATLESMVANLIASALPADVCSYLRVYTTDECRYKLFDITEAPDIPDALKKNGISTRASDPWTQLRSILCANRLRMVPSAVLAGFVAPIVSRHFLIAPSASNAITTTGPSVINLTSEAKKGRSRCTP